MPLHNMLFRNQTIRGGANSMKTLIGNKLCCILLAAGPETSAETMCQLSLFNRGICVHEFPFKKKKVSKLTDMEYTVRYSVMCNKQPKVQHQHDSAGKVKLVLQQQSEVLISAPHPKNLSFDISIISYVTYYVLLNCCVY